MTENTPRTRSPAAGARTTGRFALGCAKRGVAVVLVTGLLLTACAPLETPTERDERVRNRAKLDAAVAMFEERCKSAGEKIYRTAENVEGILLMKLRPTNESAYDQNAVDPYGSGTSGDTYIKVFLARFVGYGVPTMIGVPPSYRFVDVIDPADGKHYRYTGYMGIPPELEGKRTEPMFLLKRGLALDPKPRYGVAYDDITSPAERAVWIAGSSLRVIDLHTNEVMAERIGYMIDKGQGSTGGGRQPWTHAYRWSCPSLQSHDVSNPANFVEKVLKIKQGDQK